MIPSSFHKVQIDELNGFCAACSSDISEKSILLMQFLYSNQTNYNVNYLIYLILFIKYISLL